MRHRLTALALVAAALAGFAFAGPALYAAAVPSNQPPNSYYFEGTLDAANVITADEAAAGATGFAPATLIAAQLVCTEDSGTATLDAALQRSIDGGSTWTDVIAFTQLSASGGNTALYADVRAASAQMIGDRLRAEYDIGGTGQYTCTMYLTAEN